MVDGSDVTGPVFSSNKCVPSLLTKQVVKCNI